MPFRSNNRISDLLLAEGQSRAQAAQQSGAIWGNAAQNLGNIASRTISSLLDYKSEEPQRELLKARTAAATQDMRDTQQQKAIMPFALTQDQNGVFTYDRNVLTKEFTAAGIGDRLPEVFKGLDVADAATMQLQKAKQEAFAGLAYGVLNSGSTPEAFNLALEHAKKNGLATPQELSQIIQAVGDDPQKIAQVAKSIAGRSQAFAGVMSQDADRKADNVRADMQFGEGVRHNQTQEAIAAVSADRQVAAQQETVRHNTEMEKIGRMTAGRAEAAAAEAARHNKVMEGVAQQNATTAAAKTNPRTGLDAEIPSDYQNAFERAVLSIPATRRGPKVELANRLFKEGNLPELRQVIMQAAIEGENVDTKNQVLGRQATVAALNDAEAILKQLAAKGVPTNILSGSMEDLARKLGTSTNTEYVTLGNQLAGTLIQYRRAATGVQFGEREGAEYAKMFPNYKNTLPVNEALIAGLKGAMAANDKAYWTHKLGPSGSVLVGAMPGQAQPAAPAAAGGQPMQQPIPGVPGAIAESTDGGKTWKRVK